MIVAKTGFTLRFIEIWERLKMGGTNWQDAKALCAADGEINAVRRIAHRLVRDGLAEVRYVKLRHMPPGLILPGKLRTKLQARILTDWKERLSL